MNLMNKKFSFFLACISLMICSTYAQTSWKGTASTSWNNSANWTAGVPVSTTDVIIGDASFTGAFQPTLNAASSCKSLTIGASTKVSILTVQKNLTVSTNITIGSNGTITHSSNTTISVKGNWTKTGTYTATSNNATVTFTGTNQTLTGATTFQRMTINAGSSLSLANNITISNRLNVNGSLDPNLNIVSGAGNMTVNAGGTLMVKAATYAGNYTISGTFTMNGAGTVNYSSSTINQTVSNSFSYGYLRISGGTTKSLAGNLPLLNSSLAANGRIYVDAGIFDLLGFTANRGTAVSGGSFVIAAGATLKIGGTNTFPANYSSVVLASTSNVDYYGNNQVVSSQYYGNLLLRGTSGAVVKTMPALSMTVAGNFSTSLNTATSVTFTAAQSLVIYGNISIGASTVVNGGSFTYTFGGNWSNAGTFNGNTSTVQFSGTNAVLSGAGTNNFTNLSFSGIGISALSSCTVNVSGNLSTILSGSFEHGAGGNVNVSGASSVISGNGFTFSNCNITGTASTAANILIKGNLVVNNSLNATAGTVTMNGAAGNISGTGTLNLSSLSILGVITTTKSFNIASNLSVSGTASFTATAGTVSFNGASALTGSADLYNATVNASKSLILTSNSRLGISNLFTVSGTLDVLSSVPNTVEYNSVSAQNIAASSYYNLQIKNAGLKTATGAITVANDLTILASGSFNAGAFTHIVQRHFKNFGTFAAASSTVQLSGANSATITGASTFNNLVVNKNSSNTTVTLANNIITNNLNVTSGTMLTGANSVTITGTRSGAGIIIGTITHSHAFVSGTAYYFESAQNAITFTSPSAALNVVTEVVSLALVPDFNTSYECLALEYAITIPAGTFTNAKLRLHYENYQLNAIDEPNLNMYHYNNGTSVWDSIGFTAKDTALNYVEMQGITALAGRWTMAGTRNLVMWNGSVSSSWEDVANWTTVSGGSSLSRIPTPNDAVQIGFGPFTHHPEISTAQVISALQFGSVQSSILTISNGSLNVQGTVKGQWTGNSAHTIDVASGAIVVGSDLYLGDGVSGHNLELKIGSGSATVNYNLHQTASGAVNFTGSGTLTVKEAYNYSAGTFNAGTGTVIYSGTNSQSVAPLSYNNLLINKPTESAVISLPTTIAGNLVTSTGGELVVADTLTVNGNITIGAGTHLIETGTVIHLKGNWQNNGLFSTTGGTVNFCGTSNQSCNASTFNTVTVIKATGKLMLGGNIIINNNLLLKQGAIDLGIYSANRNFPGGILELASSTTLQVGGANNFPANYLSRTVSATSTVEYNGTVAQHVAEITYGNLTLSNGGSLVKTLHEIHIDGDFLLNSGASATCDSNAVFLKGNFTNNGTFTANMSSLVLKGVSKTFTGNTTLHNLILSGGSYSFVSSSLYVKGDFYVDTLSVANLNAINISFDSDVTNKGSVTSSGVATFTGTKVQTIRLINSINSTSTGIINFNGFVSPVLNSNSAPLYGILNINNTAGVTPSVPWTVYNTFTVGSNASFNGGVLDHYFYGSFYNNGTVTSDGTLHILPQPPFASSATVKLDGAGGSFISTGTLELGGSAAITMQDNAPAFNAVQITNTNALGVTPVTGWTMYTMLLESGATFNAGTALSHVISGDLTNDGTISGGTSTITFSGNPGSINGVGAGNYYNFKIAAGADVISNKANSIMGNMIIDGTFNNAEQTVSFIGTAASAISGAMGSVSIYNLEQNKTGGSELTLNVPVEVTNSLILTSGNINTTSSNILQLANLATSTSGSSSSFVNGPMRKTGNQDFVFPVGKGSKWARLGISAPSQVTDAFTAEYFNTAYSNITSMSGSSSPVLSNVSNVEYWTCNRSSGLSSVMVELYWENSFTSGINNLNDLYVAHWNGSAWENVGRSAVSGSSQGSITSNLQSAFSPFTFGSTSFANPLPVELLEFDAVLNSSKTVDLSWITASETNNDYFTVERSSDGLNFETLMNVDGAGNSTSVIRYNREDSAPLKGVSYYRLRQTDFNNNFSYSQMVSVNNVEEQGSFDVNVYPNPGNGEEINLSWSSEGTATLVIRDAAGKTVYSEKNVVAAERLQITLPTKLSKGAYVLTVSSGDNNINKLLIVK
jgi:hypothetical protein